MMLEILIVANLALSVIGGGGLVYWLVRHIKALEGTVKAQGETLATIGKLNDTLVNVFKALDPERWAKEVTVHKQLADEKVEVLLAAGQRKMEDEKRAMSVNTREMVDTTLKLYASAIGAAFAMIPYVPKGLRAGVIGAMNIDPETRKALAEFAEKSADWSTGGLGGLGRLGDILGSRLIVPAGTEGMAATPLPLKAAEAKMRL